MWYRFHLCTYFCLDVICFAWLIDKCSTCIFKKQDPGSPTTTSDVGSPHKFKTSRVNLSSGLSPNGTVGVSPQQNAGLCSSVPPRKFIQHIIELKTLLCFGECSKKPKALATISVPSYLPVILVSTVSTYYGLSKRSEKTSPKSPKHLQLEALPTTGGWPVGPFASCPRHSCGETPIPCDGCPPCLHH